MTSVIGIYKSRETLQNIFLKNEEPAIAIYPMNIILLHEYQ